MRRTLAVALRSLIALAACAETLSSRVVSVLDGDTITHARLWQDRNPTPSWEWRHAGN